MTKNEIIEDIKNGSLKFIDLDFVYRNDKEIVLAAVKQNGKSLYYASNELKNNKKVVLTAIKKNKRALYYTSDEFINEIGASDPVKFLESYFLQKKLNNNLINKVNNKVVIKKNKIKVYICGVKLLVFINRFNKFTIQKY